MTNTYGSLAQSARSKELRRAQVILWIIGALTLLVHGFFFVNAQKELDDAIDTELRSHGGSLSEVRSRPPEERAEFDREYAKGLGTVRMVYGCFAALGLVFIACGFFVPRKPVASVVTGLVLYVGGIAVQLALDPSSAMMGVLFKVIIIAGLVSSLKAALALERERREGAGA